MSNIELSECGEYRDSCEYSDLNHHDECIRRVLDRSKACAEHAADSDAANVTTYGEYITYGEWVQMQRTRRATAANVVHLANICNSKNAANKVNMRVK